LSSKIESTVIALSDFSKGVLTECSGRRGHRAAFSWHSREGEIMF
jgi:hypothetical protein